MKKKSFLFVPPIFFAGVLLILLPIFTFMTLDRLERQKESFTQRLLEKGISLIRTFEAGTRTGMFTMQWGSQRIQTMLLETSLQPEVDYMMITSKDGRILAHSDPEMVEQAFDAMPRKEKITPDPNVVSYRVRQQKGEAEAFEVYKRFVPTRSKFKRGHMRMNKMRMYQKGIKENHHEKGMDKKDWSQAYINSQGDKQPDLLEHYIFAGLSMERARIAKDRLVRETIFRGIFYFIMGCVGMVALFAFQAYRSAKASLTSIKAFSDNVIQNMPSGLVTINTDHDITSMNKTAKDIFNQELTSLFPEMLELIREMETTHEVVNREINLAVTPEKSALLDITSSPITGSDNKLMGYVFLFRDLTQIKELKQQVETNRRLAAIGKLAAGVAHEIRNPLSSIKGFATYFGKRYEDNGTDRETAGIMVKEVERINRSITQLLEFAKPLAIEKKQVDIKEMISHSLKLVHHDLDEKKIETKVKIETEKARIFTDGDRMNQVLLNLYINAIAALEDKGTLIIDVQDAVEGDMIEIGVMDNGKGMDMDVCDLIFDPYFTTRSTGTGLGLSIVYRIIENLGGHIRVESTRGRGTCFTISLPTV